MLKTLASISIRKHQDVDAVVSRNGSVYRRRLRTSCEQGGGEKENRKRGRRAGVSLAATIGLLFNRKKFHVMYQAEITNIAR